eukprot:1299109-Pleurochrysis_carterae.AAC.1
MPPPTRSRRVGPRGAADASRQACTTLHAHLPPLVRGSRCPERCLCPLPPRCGQAAACIVI